METIRRVAVVVLCVTIATGFTVYVFRNPFRKTDWRCLASTLHEANLEDLKVIAGDQNDMIALKYYFKRFGVEAHLVNSHYDPQVLRNHLLRHPNVWNIYRTLAVIPGSYSAQLALFPLKKVSEFRFLDVRRPALPGEVRVHILPGEKECPYLEEGWYPPHDWGEDRVRPIQGTEGTLSFDWKEPGGLTLAATVYPYAFSQHPPLTLGLSVNGVFLFSRPLHEGWNIISWNVPDELLLYGKNRIKLLANRAIAPRAIEPGNQDPRKLSVWVRDVKVIAWEDDGSG
jgi:hypothetical protein